MMKGSETAVTGFPEVWRNYLFTQLVAFPALEVSENTVKWFELFPSEVQFLAGSIALGWD